jgi:hypothetical protein
MVQGRYHLLALLLLCGCAGEEASPDAGTTSDTLLIDDRGAATCARRVLEEEVVNARELGGHPLSGGQRVACRALLRGGDLGGLSQQGCAELAGLGVRTVVDLRRGTVQEDDPPPTCVSDQASVVSAAMPKLPNTPENYRALLDEEAAVAAVFAALGDAEGYPVYIHCVIGRDRASFVTALVLLALGAERQTVIDEFMLSAEAGVAVQQPCIEAVLDELDDRGGVDSYLTAVGVTAGQLEVLRARVRVE